jgi:hypothetical protein
MDERQQVFTFMQPDIAEFLLNNQLDLVEMLRSTGHSVEKVEGSYGSDPTTSGTKDAVTILLASSAFLVALRPVLKTLFEGILHRPITVTELVPVPVEDSQGRVIPDKNGRPLLQWVERTRLIEPKRTTEATKSTAEFLGLKISYESQPKE